MTKEYTLNITTEQLDSEEEKILRGMLIEIDNFITSRARSLQTLLDKESKAFLSFQNIVRINLVNMYLAKLKDMQDANQTDHPAIVEIVHHMYDQFFDQIEKTKNLVEYKKDNYV